MLLRCHLQYPGRIETLCLESELPQLHPGKKHAQGDRRPLKDKPSLPLQ